MLKIYLRQNDIYKIIDLLMNQTIYIKCFIHLVGLEYVQMTPEIINPKLDLIMDNLNDIYNNDCKEKNWIKHPRFDSLSNNTKNNIQSYLIDITDMIDIPNIKFIYDENDYYKIYDVGENKYRFSSNVISKQVINNQLITHAKKLNIIFLSEKNIDRQFKVSVGITSQTNCINKPIVLLNGVKFNRPFSYTLAHEIGHVLGLKHPFCERHNDNEDIFPEFVNNLDKKTFKNPFINISHYDNSDRLWGNIMDYHDMVCFFTKNQVKYMREVAEKLFS